MSIENMPSQEGNKTEEMYKLYWQGKNINTIIEGASRNEIKDFARRLVEDENKNLAINLITNLLTGQYEVDKNEDSE